jgi:hypothetical protein
MRTGSRLLFTTACLLCLGALGLADSATSHRQKKAKKPEVPPIPSGPQGPLQHQIPLDSIPAVPPQVSYSNGQLTIVALNSSLADILRAVRKQTLAEMDIPATATERVVTHLGPGPAREIVADLLNGSRFNYVLLGSASDATLLTKIVLVAKAGNDAPAAANGQPPEQGAAAANPNVNMAAQAEPPDTPDPPDADAAEENTDDADAADADQPAATGDQPAVKTPQQMLQEMQQRQLQLQQQQAQPGQTPAAYPPAGAPMTPQRPPQPDQQ